MTYESSAIFGTFLREVSKTTRDGKKVCPAYFAWGVPTQKEIRHLDKRIGGETADFNGDGRDDIICGNTIYYATQAGSFVKGEVLSNEQPADHLTANLYFTEEPIQVDSSMTSYFNDLNGDGKADVIRVTSTYYRFKILNYTMTTIKACVYLSSATGISNRCIKINNFIPYTQPTIPGFSIRKGDDGEPLEECVTTEMVRYNMSTPKLYFEDLNNDGTDEMVAIWSSYKDNFDIKWDPGLNRWKMNGTCTFNYDGTTLQVFNLKNGAYEKLGSAKTILDERASLYINITDLNGDGQKEMKLHNGETFRLSQTGTLDRITVLSNSTNCINSNKESYTGDANIKASIKETSSFVYGSFTHKTQLIAFSPDLKSEVEMGSPLNEKYLSSVDINGDGKLEILTLGEAIYRMKREKISTMTSITEPDIPLEPFEEYVGNPILIRSFENSGWVVNDTLRLIKIPSMINYELYKNEDDGIKVSAKDINGDGLDDILFSWYDYHIIKVKNQDVIYDAYDNCSLYVGCPTITDCKLTETRMDGDYIPIDVDGDGIVELLDSDNQNLIDYNYNKKNILLSGVMDGFNRVTRFKYSFLADSTVYSKGSSTPTYPLVSPVLPLAVVSEMSVSDGVGGEGKLSYRYEGLKLHNEGRGLLGFTSFTTYNAATKQEMVETYDLFPEKYVLYPKQQSIKVDGSLASVTTNSYSLIHETGKNGYRLQLNSVESRDLVNGTTTSIQYKGYNEWGVSTSVSTSVGDGWSVEEATTFSIATQSKLLPAQKVVTRTYGGKSSQSTTSYEYSGDNLAKVATTTDGKSTTKLMRYDDFGNVVQEEVEGVTKKYEYDATGRFPVSETLPGNLVITYAYDSYGCMTSKKDANGFETKMAYNGLGALVRTELPDGIVATSTAAWSNDPTAVYSITTTKSGEANSISYFDMFGREIKSIERGFNGEVVSTATYNQLGQKVSATVPHYTSEPSQSIAYSYDTYGRLTSEKGPSVNRTYSYSPKKVDVSDYLLGYTVTKEYDAAGKLKKSTDLGTITYDYTANGALNKVGAFGSTWQMEYDGWGNRVKLSDPNAGVVSTQYNSKGQLEKNTTPIGTSSSSYDAMGRPTAVSNGEFDITYTYDRQLKGMVDEVRGNGITQSYTYDSKGRVTLYKETILGRVFETKYTYDGYGRTKTATYPNGFTLSYDYSSNGDLVQVKDAASSGGFICKLVEATALGKAKRVQLGNGLEVSKEYNERGQVTSIIDGKLEQEYAYDTGKLLQMTGRTHRYESGKYEQREQLTYDLYNRLTGVEGKRSETFRYADNGNMIARSSVGEYVYDGGRPNALAHVRRPADADTSTIAKATQDITYTAFGKVKSITEGDYTMELTYGPDGELKVETLKRKGQLVRTRYRVGSLYEVVQQPGTPDRVVCYVEGVDGLAAAQVTEPGKQPVLYYLHKDHLGSIMQIINQSGAVVENRSYDVWGSPRDPQTGKLLSNLKWLVGKGYTGHEHLPEFRLVNMQGRLYDPVLCRFLSPDPYVQEPDNSQNLNRYSYCFNNPLAYTDPSGLWIYENGNYYTEDKNDIARLWNFLNGFGSGSFDASTIRGFAASEITTGQQFAFYRYGMEGPGGQKIDHYVYLTGFTVYRSIFGQFTVDKSSFNRMIAARNKFMDDFSGVGSGAKVFGSYSIDNAVTALNENGYPSYAAAKAAGDGARCARFIRWALEAGFGLQQDALKGKAPVPARQYGSFLEVLGFTQVNTTDYIKGDIAVIQGYPGGTADINGVPYGHVQMFNGTQWISNYYQNNFWPGSNYQKYQPTFQIYRINP